MVPVTIVLEDGHRRGCQIASICVVTEELFANIYRVEEGKRCITLSNSAACLPIPSNCNDIFQVVNRLRELSFSLPGNKHRYCQNCGVSCITLCFRLSYSVTKALSRSCRLEMYARA